MGYSCGGLDERGVTAVVVRQSERRRGREILSQTVEVLRIRAAEAVDGLIGITDDEQPLSWTGDQFDQTVLNRVDVLKLVHEQVLRAGAHAAQQGRALLQVAQQIEQDIVEVARTIAIQQVLIGAVDGAQRLVDVGRSQAVCFESRDTLLHSCCAAVGDAGLGHRQLDQATRFLGVEDDPGRALVRLPPPQPFEGNRVKRADRQLVEVPGAPGVERMQPLPYFGGSPIGEGDRRDLPGRGAPRVDEVGDAVDECARLARSGSRQHRDRAACHLRGAALMHV